MGHVYSRLYAGMVETGKEGRELGRRVLDAG